jgi:hypothetical protein
MGCLLLCALCSVSVARDPQLVDALAHAGENRPEMEKALRDCPTAERPGVEFLIVNMPDADRKSLLADFLLTNTHLAYLARERTPWGKSIPMDLFLNDVLPYANVDEKRDPWRQEFFNLCMPLVKGCQTPAEAARKLNGELFGKLKLKYSTRRRTPNQSARESIRLGLASCTGLSIVLADACRAVCVPARLAGTPLWSSNRGNHTWVEVWDKGWHFTGAGEQDPHGLDHGWFVGEAAQAQKDSFEHAIYAASFRRGNIHFPLVWAMNNRDVPAVNVTDRYARRKKAPADIVRLLVRVVGPDGSRVAEKVRVVADPNSKGAVSLDGLSRGETADTNDILGFDLKRGVQVIISVAGVQRKLVTSATGSEQWVEVAVPNK